MIKICILQPISMSSKMKAKIGRFTLMWNCLKGLRISALKVFYNNCSAPQSIQNECIKLTFEIVIIVMPSYIVLKMVHFYHGSSGFNDKLKRTPLKEMLRRNDTEIVKEKSVCLCVLLSFVAIFFFF